ncbi:2Fe-2S iron-sulfur cluster-binding protein [Martelella soudanensis]|uniref:2Fe-2S iron-sulfur cluster-binding protein n=1 Tax=unclassified Martelella TaxID=2629616 RepID=UPI0015E037D1|nr:MULTISPECIES: 2Fe-2S iron-sulfur cluster-binding protein [unclassified Martelella]
MINIHVTTRNGSPIDLSVPTGRSLMETLRGGGIDDIAALCGGSCSCATCHVYVEPSAYLEDISDGEADMLDSLLHQKENSRLSCQITVTEGMDDLRVEIAPEE